MPGSVIASAVISSRRRSLPASARAARRRSSVRKYGRQMSLCSVMPRPKLPTPARWLSSPITRFSRKSSAPAPPWGSGTAIPRKPPAAGRARTPRAGRSPRAPTRRSGPPRRAPRAPGTYGSWPGSLRAGPRTVSRRIAPDPTARRRLGTAARRGSRASPAAAARRGCAARESRPRSSSDRAPTAGGSARRSRARRRARAAAWKRLAPARAGSSRSGR